MKKSISFEDIEKDAEHLLIKTKYLSDFLEMEEIYNSEINNSIETEKVEDLEEKLASWLST